MSEARVATLGLLPAGPARNLEQLTHSKLSFLQEPHAGGMRLIVMVEARSKLRPILFVGNSAISAKRLRNQIELVPNQSWDDLALQQARDDIRAAYSKAGYPDVDVSYRIAAGEAGYSLITFSIDEGQLTLLDDIRFEGNHAFTDRELTAKMKLKERKLLKLFGKHGKVDNQTLEDDVLAIEGQYRDAGYIDARVIAVDRRPSAGADHIDLVRSISEGLRHRVGKVAVTGAEAVSPQAIMSKLQLQPSMMYSAKALREDIEFLRSYYGRKGYLNLHVRPILNSAGDGVLDVEYSIYSDVGFGVRISLKKDAPPLRIDYAFPLKTDRFGDGGGKLSVQMGFKF